ncbi:glycoside hydrolase family 2 TIM barrel-domain containing protein [Mediterraneibacter glycyrrhizinilyticus]|uniref:glycoside hydrolase family 2 TIM barrel-domain containing protein n=1 Tax=Mediterraneibacter glycyrrhizinilyticus TaxID=342942 RepID=UPI0025A49586|nr:glycoside hydrolase family 2 TIM barrel-domain containing protein [Mediterraneibacter glycyrrhizinilyticus]MDM8211444.1 glycoside hydrolase family 2 TIM barrel-domain containing protein [Mediterraneibacter glycyrrhizinilyticus]
MKRLDFNRGWTYRRIQEEGPGKEVRLPHDAMISEKRTEDSAGGINTGWFEGYDYIYEKEFDVPKEYEGHYVSFEFEGVYHNAEIWLNGEKAAFRPYGYSDFYVDASGYLKYGEKNQIRVIARNVDQPNSRWYSGAGIYRPVWMYTAPAGHILQNGIRVKTISTSPAVIEAEIRTTCPGTLDIRIIPEKEEQDPGEYGNERHSEAGVVAAVQEHTDGAATVRLTVPDARLWTVDTPDLYRLYAVFTPQEGKECDSQEITFGIRTIGWDRGNGFSMNGERVILRGACIHHDNGVLGACCYPEAEERKIRILRENGYNAIRSAHNPCSKALLDACDRIGMLVMDEFVDVWYIHKTEYDYVNYFNEWWKQDLKDMVRKDFNHPCVIMYSTGNEVSETAQPKGIKLTKKMTEYLHHLDETRPVTCGINIFFNFLSSIGFGVYSDKKAKKEAEKAAKHRGKNGKKKEKAVGSQFFNNLAGMFGSGFMKTGATFYGCDAKTRDAFANMDIAGYNYGIKRYRHDLKKYPDRLILGSETFCSDAYEFWEMAKENPRIIGDFVWAGMDYLGEVGVGSWEYRDYAPDFAHGPGWITAGSGRIDLTGKPLAEAGYTKTAFELTDKPVIAVRPVNHTDEKHSPSAWKMTNAVESWSWAGCEGKKAYVEVYARAAKIDLFLNGRLIGSRELKNRCDTTFTVEYRPGRLEAVAYDDSGREISGNALETAGSETILQAVPENKSVRPDGLCFIRLQYTDKAGTVKPLERGILHVNVTNGELLGLGNGCPYNETGYCGDKTDTYFGEALAVVRAAEDAGARPVVVEVTDGVHTGLTEIEVE